MPFDTARARQLLVKGDLRALFIEELGWDRHPTALHVTLDNAIPTLSVLAQKRGMVAYQCPTPNGGRLPDYAERRKIEHQVAKSAHEHLIVFTDAQLETQIWQWVKREPGKPAACREHTFHRTQPGDALLQRLQPARVTAWSGAPVVQRLGWVNAMQQRVGHRDRAHCIVGIQIEGRSAGVEGVNQIYLDTARLLTQVAPLVSRTTSSP